MSETFFDSVKNVILNVLKSQRVNMMITFGIIFLATYISVMTVFGYPTSNPDEEKTEIDERLVHIILSLIILLFLSLTFSQLLYYIRINRMVGSLLFGVLVTNIPTLNEFFIIPSSWDSAVRRFALVNIVIKWGLSINLRYISTKLVPTLLIGVCSALCEAICITVIFYFWFGLGFFISVIFGCVLATASAPIAAPTIGMMKSRNVGTEKHLTDVIPASICLDNIVCILIYSIVSSLFFTNDNLITHFLVDIGAIVLLCAIGSLTGYLLWRYPHHEAKHSSLARFCLVLSVPTAFIWGMMSLGFQFSGIAATLCFLSVAHHYWKNTGVDAHDHTIENVSQLYRFISSPLLFSLVGRKFPFELITMDFVRVVIVAITVGYIVRFLTTMFFTRVESFHWRDQTVVALTLIPKATVQCALAPFASVFGEHYPEYKKDMDMLIYAAIISVVVSVCIIENLLEFVAPRILREKAEYSVNGIENGKEKKMGRIPDESDVVKTLYKLSPTYHPDENQTKPARVAVIRLQSNELGRVHPSEQPARNFGLQ